VETDGVGLAVACTAQGGGQTDSTPETQEPPRPEALSSPTSFSPKLQRSWIWLGLCTTSLPRSSHFSVFLKNSRVGWAHALSPCRPSHDGQPHGGLEGRGPGSSKKVGQVKLLMQGGRVKFSQQDPAQNPQGARESPGCPFPTSQSG
jgi:hypothetical protein